MSTLAGRLRGKRVVICAGAGGVGKTTVSAAVALGLAADGARVALVTIDPARRLAEALGLRELDNEPRPMDPRRFAGTQVQLRGELSAMMLDVGRTFDELIGRLAPDGRTRDQILANRVYRSISTAVAGSQEYSAIAKLFELDRERAYDVIVLDTPPSRNALDFLDAPERLTAFLEGRALAAFVRPARRASRAMSVVLGALGRVIGAGMLTDLAAFFQLISGLTEGFRERASGVRTLLGERSTAFVVISSPERRSVEEAIYFAGELASAGMHRSALIVNRVHPRDDTGDDAGRSLARLSETLGAGLAQKVARAHGEMQVLARGDAVELDRLCEALGEREPLCLAGREGDVRDVAGLAELCRELFDQVPARRAQ